MKKIYKLEGLCCANCAAKIENEIAKVDGVEKAVLAFMTQKLTMDVVDDKVDAVVAECEKIIHKIEPDVEIIKVR